MTTRKFRNASHFPTLSWTDLIRKDEDHFLDLLDDHSSQDQDTVDELGFGRVRDFYSDIFFPGITTLLTRARYIILTPLLMNQLGHASQANARRQIAPDSCLHDWERAINDHFKGIKEEGAIGKVKKDRRFTKIYWPVLSKLNMIHTEWTDFSMPEFVARIGRPEHDVRNENRESIGSESEDPWDAELAELLNDQPSLQFNASGLKRRSRLYLTLTLSAAEADFLRSRFVGLGKDNGQNSRESLWKNLFAYLQETNDADIPPLSILNTLARNTSLAPHARNAVTLSRFVRTMYIAYWYHVAQMTKASRFSSQMAALERVGTELTGGLLRKNEIGHIKKYLEAGYGLVPEQAKTLGYSITDRDLPRERLLRDWLEMLTDGRRIFEEPGRQCLSELESENKGVSRSRLIDKETTVEDLEKTLQSQTQTPTNEFQYFYRLRQAVSIASDIAHPTRKKNSKANE